MSVSNEDYSDEVLQETPTPEQVKIPPVMDDDEIKKFILNTSRDIDTRESDYRSDHVRDLKKLDLFWHGIQRLYWSEADEDYKTISDIEDPILREQLDGMEQVINIYRAHGESIIAALSTGVPQVKFGPNDADNPIDIQTAKAYSNASILLSKRLKSPLLFIKALFTIWNQDYVAAYHYPIEDGNKFGFHKEQETKFRTVEVPVFECNECDYISPTPFSLCPICTSNSIVQSVRYENQPYVEVIQIPKASEKIEIYGPLNVVIDHNSRTIEDTGYLKLFTEHNINRLYATYPALMDEITGGESGKEEDRDNRATHGSSFDTDTVTTEQLWIRPWMYYSLGKNNKDQIDFLLQEFPDGLYAVIVQDKVAIYKTENLDDRWTLSHSPESRTIISDPLGQGLVSIQETVNDLYSLSRETIAQGISETFYDSNILDADKYKQLPSAPGMMVPVKRQAGQSIGESFFQFKPATLGKEVDTFRARNDTDAQFLSGAFPSIYGGANEGSSGTLGEYSLSRNMALQRLQIHYKSLVFWWNDMFYKVTKDFIEHLLEDEKFTIRKGSLYSSITVNLLDAKSGQIAEVEPENSEQLPTSWAQLRDTTIQMMQFNNENLNAALFHPENVEFLASILGMSNFYIPGEEDRLYQLREIQQLIKTQPIQGEFIPVQGPNGLVVDPNTSQPAMQQGQPTPSVPIDPDIDNHQIHFTTVQSWAISANGQETKKTNPAGYQNVLLHGKAHKQILNQMQMVQAQMQSNQNKPKGEVPKEKLVKTPEMKRDSM